MTRELAIIKKVNANVLNSATDRHVCRENVKVLTVVMDMGSVIMTLVYVNVFIHTTEKMSTNLMKRVRGTMDVSFSTVQLIAGPMVHASQVVAVRELVLVKKIGQAHSAMIVSVIVDALEEVNV